MLIRTLKPYVIPNERVNIQKLVELLFFFIFTISKIKKIANVIKKPLYEASSLTKMKIKS